MNDKGEPEIINKTIVKKPEIIEENGKKIIIND